MKKEKDFVIDKTKFELRGKFMCSTKISNLLLIFVLKTKNSYRLRNMYIVGYYCFKS